MALGTTLTVVQSGSTMTMPVEEIYQYSQPNLPVSLIVNMTVPNLVGATASTPGPYIIDSFKVMLRHQNTHALVNAAFVWGVSAGTVTSARIFDGAVGKELFRAVQTEAALVGNPINQATHDACQTALQTDISVTGSSTYYGSTDAYRRQAAAGLLFKVRSCVALRVRRSAVSDFEAAPTDGSCPLMALLGIACLFYLDHRSSVWPHMASFTFTVRREGRAGRRAANSPGLMWLLWRARCAADRHVPSSVCTFECR